MVDNPVAGMSDFTAIRQPAGQRTLALREAYLAICEGDACEAHLLNAQERWYTYKLKHREQARAKNKTSRLGGDPEEESEALWVRMNADGWAEELLRVYNEKTVRMKLAGLVKRGFLATRNNPRQAWDRTPQWLFQRAAVQDAVDDWDARRERPDLDPGAADAPEDHPDVDADSTRTIVRMDAEEVPGRAGQSSALTRTNLRSNNTGVLTQESLHSLQDRSSIEPLKTDAPEVPVPGAAAGEANTHGQPRLDQPGGRPPRAPKGAGAGGPSETDAAPAPVQAQPQALQSAQPATAFENVPPASAPYAILTLRAVPRAELEARAVREPSVILKGLLNASNRKRLAHLQSYLGGATQTGGVPRDLLLRLTDEELLSAQVAAKADAHHPGGMAKFSALGLDRLIGAPITAHTIEGAAKPAEVPGGAAYRVTNEPGRKAHKAEAERPPEPGEPTEDYRVGAQWRRREDDQLVTIQEAQGAKRVLSDGTTIELFRLVKRYAFHAPAPAEAVAS